MQNAYNIQKRSGFRKPISWPAKEKVIINIEHILSNHTLSGFGYIQSTKAGGRKDAFPETWSKDNIELIIRKAYNNIWSIIYFNRW